jgi:Family of unknown function (DUF6278)
MSDERQSDKNGIGSNGAGSNGVGSYDLHDEAEAEAAARPPAPLPPPPERVAELCAACMRFVASKYKVSLDGTPDTLSLLDQYVREAREAAQERPESVELVAPAVGAYLGEVMRQMFRGEWWAEGDYDSWRLYFTNVYLAFNPLGMALEAITMTDAEGWNAHLTLDPGEREEIEERLAAMPEVDEEEYYLPTTRLDVVTAVVETLRARAEGAGTGDVTFSKDDYT